MGGLQWTLELGLVVLLAATLFHAVRLERALGVLKRDRASLEGLVQGFNASTQQAEASVERLRGAVDGAGRQIARQIEAASGLKEDLVFLTERGERLADRLDQLVRTGRPLAAELPRHGPAELPRHGPAELPRHGPAELPRHGPAELPRHGPAELPRHGPAELPRHGPAELPRHGPAELPRHGPAELPRHGPAELARNVAALPRREPAREAVNEAAEEPRVRSQAERDLLQALRLAR